MVISLLDVPRIEVYREAAFPFRNPGLAAARPPFDLRQAAARDAC
jgi:hypothetical protein